MEIDVVVRCGEEELLVDYPVLLDADHHPTFSDRNDLFQMVGEAVEKCICEMKKKFMKTITLSEFKGLPERSENIGDLSFLNENKGQHAQADDVVFLKERTSDDTVMIVQRLIVEDV